jgi:hypothetical protein
MTASEANKVMGKTVQITDVYGDTFTMTVTGRNRYSLVGNVNGVEGHQALVDRSDVKTWSVVR